MTISKIDLLLTSWNEVAQRVGLPLNAAFRQPMLPKVLLVARGDTIQFELKPKKPLLARLFKRAPREEQFPQQLAAIKGLFASIASPSSEEQRKLLSLEERLNELGRYVYAGRCKNTLFGSPNLDEYQIRHFTPTTTLLPPDEIRRGLINTSWTLCWLNASLKYMAGCDLYDVILTTPKENLGLEKLRLALFRIVDGLRRNWDQNVINALQQELIQVLSENAHFAHFLRGQEDADEFIRTLENRFSPVRPEYVEDIKIYTSNLPNVKKEGKSQIYKGTINIQLHIPEDKVVNFVEALNEEDAAPGMKEYIKDNVAIQNGPPLDFTQRTYYVHFPDRVEFFKKRDIIGYNPAEEVGDIKHPQFKLNDDGTVTLIEYEAEKTGPKNSIFSAKAKTRLTYKVIAGFERCKSKEVRAGHFIAHTRGEDGTITTHNDYVISPHQSESVWANCYWLSLKCVKREAM